ncbi:MAG: RelA/SpoT domain-containing protein [Hyphomicrobium sp.]
MTLDEYIKHHLQTYSDFAATVVQIINAGFSVRAEVVQPLICQARAKAAESLRTKLGERGLLESENIEAEVKDLAGCRLIFYTNTDAERFLQARIVFDNFVVDWDNTKIHHPIESDPKAERHCRAVHYIISLTPERLALPEYARFAGFRAEIQIQTLLNHSWSETAHDIIYKNLLPSGFGARQLVAIKKRMAGIMTKYLIPAGYEFQKVQHDVERLRQGKEIFERGPIEELDKAGDNNQRVDLLSRLSEQVLPQYDDVPSIHPELLRAIVAAVKSARETEPKAIETVFG